MAIKIEKKITAYNLVTPETEEEKSKAEAAASNVVQMGAPLSRPEDLVGNTYKIKHL